ncbi:MULTISPECIES: hypothetical protein [unclassified Oceanobacter]|uniref:hypothetical protein n=1 Tax=unclassified Oceanobacter TaxID=2620260 RepID=UPI00273268C5|nr:MULTISPECIES: hypothetical protein [unclassified Oceanobacter]MDP2607760.1 hypothetical protein [Oceanobacter sp. 1_MG-2023]MDP2611056.1 hypothetical protein [Oceanobacter sp. 2_MG-2023]
MIIEESGLRFGPFNPEQIFHIEKSSFVSSRLSTNGIKICEFVYLSELGDLMLVEAKSSVPDPGKSKSTYEDFFWNIFEKLDNSFQILLAGYVTRDMPLNAEISAPLLAVDWQEAAIRFYLVIPEVPDQYLPPMTDKLNRLFKRHHSIWRMEIKVINARIAQSIGLLV